MPATRAATPEDAPAVARIYNEGMADRIATFETRERSEAEVAERLRGPHPAVVALDESGAVVAFAWSSPYSAREAYATIGDHGVYVAREARGHRYGEAALRALMDAAWEAGLHKLTSRVFVENTASRRLHARCRLPRGGRPPPPRPAGGRVAGRGDCGGAAGRGGGRGSGGASWRSAAQTPVSSLPATVRKGAPRSGRPW